MATLPGHKWKVSAVDKEKSAFVYTCTRCKCVTLSGVPLPAPFDKVCQLDKH
jgi:hypothetical protein